jgi:hypothetical protein
MRIESVGGSTIILNGRYWGQMRYRSQGYIAFDSHSFRPPNYMEWDREVICGFDNPDW